MGKRLRRVASGTDSSSTTDSEGEPKAKRTRLLSPSAQVPRNEPLGLNDLPTEIHDLINHYLVVEDDMITTLKHLGRVRNLSPRFEKRIAYSFGEKRVKQINIALKGWDETVARFPVAPPENTVKGQTLSYLRTQSGLVALHSKEGRRHITSGVLAHKGEDFQEASVLNLIRNIDYIEPDQRSKLVRHVAEYRLADHLVAELAARVDRVPVAERSLVVNESLLLDEPDRSSALEHLAGHLDSLEQGDRKNMLNEAKTPGQDRSRLLAACGVHADAFELDEQTALITGICNLPEDDSYKMQGLNAVSKCFERLDPELQPLVARQILRSVEQPQQAPLRPDQPWYTAPHRSRIEALQSMLSNTATEDNGNAFRFAIDRLMAPSGRPDLAAQAQLVPFMDEDERPFLSTDRMPDADAIDEDVMYRLTLRVADLDPDEKVAYLTSVQQMDHDSEAYRNIVSYNLSHHLAAFTPKQRSSLVTAQLAIADEDPIQADSAFKRIADGAKYLQRSDIRAAVTTAGQLADNNSGAVLESSRLGASIKSCPGHTARMLERWTAKILLRGPKPVQRPAASAPQELPPADTGSPRPPSETLYPDRDRSPGFNR
ncbi:hypothetical protein RvVAR0630_pl07360 (plasmid) [Agrobacterium vitis]|uniref:hypothetical protein n=1 Tax=Agrobacterium vitis TaxID=373 RepID=UPI0015D8B28B|nr:hypothetical protein [Agrobacterium vitis]BCH62594.1 hypothetical protein RvVAR0630_pl07360 [Agrobacterium vitis]